MRSPVRILAALLSVIAFLLLTNTWLWVKNQTYRQRNRELILENDSLQAVNIKLAEKKEKRLVMRKEKG
ncbi:hypothetical protein V9K67_13575 [Paraflavisolibacter sp. H34]|uniref:hypothetical protein n=1 Tax=Huijunlia imazamoxiresistens TaxID=3127457 RepID=UPI003015C157